MRRRSAALLTSLATILLFALPSDVPLAQAPEPVLLKDINAGVGASTPTQFIEVGGVVFFAAFHPDFGTELWRSDGTEAGTVLVKDILPGSSSSNPQHLTNVDGTLFFSASDGVNGFELWRSDGTEAGTVLVKDIRPGADSSQ